MTRKKKIAAISALSLLGLLLAIAIAAVLVFRSDWFRNRVRERIVAEVEKATGGRAEIGKFDFDWRTLRAQVDDFVLHGAEQADQPPLARIQSVAVGLTVISALERKVDLRLLELDEPEIRILVYPDGSTNLPSPKVRRTDRTVTEEILNLAVSQFVLRDGVLEVDSKRIPLDARCRDLNARFLYDAAGPRYHGQVASRQLEIHSTNALPLAVNFDADVIVEKDRIEFPRALVSLKESRVELGGAVGLTGSYTGRFVTKAVLALSELERPFHLPVAAGTVTLDGNAAVSFANLSDYTWDGKLSARGVVYRVLNVQLHDIGARADLSLTPAKVALSQLSVTTEGATFSGRVDIEEWARFQAEGVVKDFSIHQAARFASSFEKPGAQPAGTQPRAFFKAPVAAGTGRGGSQPLPWDGVMEGPVKAEGRFAGHAAKDMTVQAAMTIRPAPGANPFSGYVDAVWQQRSGTIHFENSWVATPSNARRSVGQRGGEPGREGPFQ